MRIGDTVFHRPSGETWVLAWATETEVSPCGWPESIARREDCELVSAATDDEAREMAQQWAAHKGHDYRASQVRHLYADLLVTGQGPQTEKET